MLSSNVHGNFMLPNYSRTPHTQRELAASSTAAPLLLAPPLLGPGAILRRSSISCSTSSSARPLVSGMKRLMKAHASSAMAAKPAKVPAGVSVRVRVRKERAMAPEMSRLSSVATPIAKPRTWRRRAHTPSLKRALTAARRHAPHLAHTSPTPRPHRTHTAPAPRPHRTLTLDYEARLEGEAVLAIVSGGMPGGGSTPRRPSSSRARSRWRRRP
eukprot:scaffold91215_cov45-Phaeocystis_antarctica.AAC.2